MAVYKNCKNCGVEFKPSVDRRFYCCEDCRKKATGSGKRKKPLDVKSNFESITEISNKAMAMGLSYGEYVAKYGV